MKKTARPLENKLIAEIRSAIADDDRTHYRLARDSGVDEASIRKFMSRERLISLESADRLASALGLALVRKGNSRRKIKEEMA